MSDRAMRRLTPEVIAGLRRDNEEAKSKGWRAEVGVDDLDLLLDAVSEPTGGSDACCADHDDCHLPGELICCDRCPDIARCACGHGWHQHDPEAVPALCLLCGDSERCVIPPG